MILLPPCADHDKRLPMFSRKGDSTSSHLCRGGYKVQLICASLLQVVRCGEWSSRTRKYTSGLWAVANASAKRRPQQRITKSAWCASTHQDDECTVLVEQGLFLEALVLQFADSICTPAVSGLSRSVDPADLNGADSAACNRLHSSHALRLSQIPIALFSSHHRARRTLLQMQTKDRSTGSIHRS